MNAILKKYWDRDKEMIDCMGLYIDHVLTIAESKFNIHTEDVFKDTDTTNIFNGDIRYQFVLSMPLGIEIYIYSVTTDKPTPVFTLKNKFGDIDISYDGTNGWLALKEFAHDVKDYSEKWKYIFDNGRLKYDRKIIE